ncbi:hypothetical protein V9T40_014757 [Parthenolecanium corni]|uniref:Uncharacterized protein n=1 Tax=Parthenolecanium corni TaxID=536013 RepID=A0AAN9T5B2_9HEMI
MVNAKMGAILAAALCSNRFIMSDFDVFTRSNSEKREREGQKGDIILVICKNPPPKTGFNLRPRLLRCGHSKAGDNDAEDDHAIERR